MNDPYTIDPMTYAMVLGNHHGLIAGDLIDMLTGATIVGPYCFWPKHERKEFIITGINKDYPDKIISLEPRHVDIVWVDEPGIYKYSDPNDINSFELSCYPAFREGDIVTLNNCKKSFIINSVGSLDKLAHIPRKPKRKKDWEARYPWEK